MFEENICFYHMFQTDFLTKTKFERHKKDLEVSGHECSPCLRAWTEPSPESLPLGPSYLCWEARHSQKFIFNSQHEQHLQIVQINYTNFLANARNRLVVST